MNNQQKLSQYIFPLIAPLNWSIVKIRINSQYINFIVIIVFIHKRNHLNNDFALLSSCADRISVIISYVCVGHNCVLILIYFQNEINKFIYSCELFLFHWLPTNKSYGWIVFLPAKTHIFSIFCFQWNLITFFRSFFFQVYKNQYEFEGSHNIWMALNLQRELVFYLKPNRTTQNGKSISFDQNWLIYNVGHPCLIERRKKKTNPIVYVYQKSKQKIERVRV